MPSNSPTLSETTELPPGPGSPRWWQLARFAHEPLEMFDECAARWGDAFTLDIAGHGRFVMLSNPETVRGVFRGDPGLLHSGESNEIFSATVGRNSVLVLDGDPHKRQRRVLVPPLKGERMRYFFAAMRTETIEATHSWPLKTPFPALPEMRKITLRVILRAGLGLPAGTELNDLERRVERLVANGRQRHALLLMQLVPIHLLSKCRWAPFFRQLNQLDDALFPLIAARRKGERPPVNENVLDDLLAARHEDGAPMSDQEVRDAIITIVIAGYDTTALALSWALVEILSHGEVVERVTEELREVTGGGPPEPEQLAKLKYLDAAIREVLRIRPIAPFVVRKTKQRFTAGGRTYPAGVTLCPCSYLVHHREELYPDAGRFRAERFLERKFGPHEWFPFGGGNRVCLGMPFALYEMSVVLATLFSQIRLSRPPSSNSRAIRHGVLLGPHDGARVFVDESRAPTSTPRQAGIAAAS